MDNMKKRLLIFCFYNENGIVSNDVLILLKQLRKVVSSILLVVNGSVNNERIFDDYVDQIIIRENIGLDFGAYREALQSENHLYEYDEIVLCNDTFYGFFEPIENIFSKMEVCGLDVWGLNYVDRIILKHIQSYFLVIKSNVFADLYDYFVNNEMITSFAADVAYMEPKLFRYLTEKGYYIGSYTDTNLEDVYSNPLECIKKYNLPILKKKSFRKDHCDRKVLNETIQYIEDNNLYPGKLEKVSTLDNEKIIRKKRLSKSRINETELLEWANNDDFYIFGAGIVANELYHTYFKDVKTFKGFVVSKCDNENAYAISDIPDDARIILGVRQEIQGEVREILPNSMEILYLWDE